MSAGPSPLATPAPWDAVADAYTLELNSLFDPYARDALRLAELPPGGRLLDVACGPGTLSFLAAPSAGRVDALDFAPAMIAQLERRAAAEGVSNIVSRVGDGQALPFEDDVFDVAVSMFGLIFFPDRARGFQEMRRVLKPGGRAVVSSWAPLDRVPLLAAVFKAMSEELPPPAGGGGRPPLTDPAEFKAEMEAAGFRDVVVHEILHRGEAESIQAYWRSNARTAAPISLLRKRLGDEAFARFSSNVEARLVAHFGTGPLDWNWAAHLGVGRK